MKYSISCECILCSIFLCTFQFFLNVKWGKHIFILICELIAVPAWTTRCSPDPNLRTLVVLSVKTIISTRGRHCIAVTWCVYFDKHSASLSYQEHAELTFSKYHNQPPQYHHLLSYIRTSRNIPHFWDACRLYSHCFSTPDPPHNKCIVFQRHYIILKTLHTIKLNSHASVHLFMSPLFLSNVIPLVPGEAHLWSKIAVLIYKCVWTADMCTSLWCINIYRGTFSKATLTGYSFLRY